MGALKWIGYTVAALLVLCVATGAGMFIAVVVAIGGALVCLFLLVLAIAAVLEWICAPRSRKR